MSWSNLIELMPAFLEGTWQAVKLFCLTLLFSLPLGFVLCAGRMSKRKLISMPMAMFQYVIRGTPLMLQLIFVMYFPGIVLQIKGFDRFLAACLAFIINYAAYFSEIYRSGIESIPQGQREAAAVLGLTRWQTMQRIIIPQMFKRIMPSLGNEAMTLVKDTALASTIGIIELLRVANNHMNRTASMVPIIVALVFYLIMNGVVNLLSHNIENKLNYYKL